MNETSPAAAPETELALMCFAQVVMDVIFVNKLASPQEFSDVLGLHQKMLEGQGFPTGARMLGLMRQIAQAPSRQRMREEIERLIVEQPKGTA